MQNILNSHFHYHFLSNKLINSIRIVFFTLKSLHIRAITSYYIVTFMEYSKVMSPVWDKITPASIISTFLKITPVLVTADVTNIENPLLVLYLQKNIRCERLFDIWTDQISPKSNYWHIYNHIFCVKM